LNYFTKKTHNVFRSLVQRYGPEDAKRKLWNGEFASGHWKQLEAGGDESVHLLVERYASKGSILDLGCGPGTTGIELDPAAYSIYTGVDISDVAVLKARNRAQMAGRAERNQYLQSDILTYVPMRPYDVILYGESIYYVPVRRVAAMLDRYATYLTPGGVFVARFCEVTGKLREVLDIIEGHCQVAEKHLREQTRTCLIVFRPRVGPSINL
jgi:SAM-dependent methyltransferase